jgi:hypothetical protein
MFKIRKAKKYAVETVKKKKKKKKKKGKSRTKIRIKASKLTIETRVMLKS